MRLWLVFFTLTLPLLWATPPLVLQTYGGTWKVTRKSNNTAKEELKNLCMSAGSFYVCQQSTNGSIVGLLIFTPAGEPNHFYTQNVMPDGRATGKGELIIERNKWVFASTWNGGATVTRYRTTDTFVTPNEVQFTQEESTDGSHWQLKDSGNQARVSH